MMTTQTLQTSGSVTLVGAGPGHVDYLSVKGLRILQQAEVILYDALIDASFHEVFPAHAKLMYVGKRCGAHACSQEEIQAILYEHAAAGLRVVRLKGGDPFVFGRGGEELLYLRERGIHCEVVPGMSALNAAGALAGIPLTHRGVAGAVMVLNGHDREQDWAAVASFAGTVVIFMGKHRFVEIAGELLRHGAAPSLPFALVESASSVEQRTHFGVLGDAQSAPPTALCAGPGIIYIGKVVQVLRQAGQGCAEVMLVNHSILEGTTHG